jgi:hypothetical protein
LIIKSAVPGAFCSGADLKVKKNTKDTLCMDMYAEIVLYNLGACYYEAFSSHSIFVYIEKSL